MPSRPVSRTALAAVAFASLAAAFAVPAGRANDAGSTPATPRTPRGVTTVQPIAVVPRRDPFAAPILARATTAPAFTGASVPRFPAALPVLPPNAGAPPLPFPAPGASASPPAFAPPALRIGAIVTGSHPVALAFDGAVTRLLAVGDRVGPARVAAIDAGGVRLDDGVVLRIDPAHTRSTPGGL